MQAHPHRLSSTAGPAPTRLRKFSTPWMLVALFCVASFTGLQPAICHGELLRVTTWNLGLQPPVADTANTLQEAAASLRLLNPDVILLQQINNWKTCVELTELLKPFRYQVLVCSAFAGPSTNSAAEPQMAILAKSGAYFTWSQAWSNSNTQTGGQGGVVFATLQAGTQRIAFFNALCAQNDPEQPAALLLSQIQSIQGWETNQVQTFVLATSAGTKARAAAKRIRKTAAALERAGFVDATEALPLEARSTIRNAPGTAPEIGDILFVGPAGFPTSTRILQAPGFTHFPITSDIELDKDKVALALDIRADNRREREAKTSATRLRLVGTGAAVLAVYLVFKWSIRRRSKKKTTIATPSRHRSAAEESAKESSGLVRPIIFVDSPSKARPVAGPAPVARPKPVLRIQNPSRTSPERSPAPDSQPEQTGGESEPEGPPRALETARPAAQARLATSDPAVRQGVIQELAGWLKHKLVRKLVSDRQQMMHANELATRMATTLDNRLARIEAQIQKQNQAYLKRIDDLNRDLAAAREENRELIRERIAQVKAEMDAARAKVLAEADLNNSSLRL